MAMGNSVNDEIKEQHRKVIEEMKPKDRFIYFFSYYKVHVLVILLFILLFSYIIYSNVTKKDVVLEVVYVNGFPSESTSAIMDDFSKTIDFNPKKEEVILDDSFYIASKNRTTYDDQNEQKLYLMSSTGSIDVCIVDEAYFKHMAKQGNLLDLSTILTDDEMAKYKDRLFYYDSPENEHEGEEAIGLEVTNSPKLVKTNSFPNTKSYYCIIMNSKNIDNALAFLHYIELP